MNTRDSRQGFLGLEARPRLDRIRIGLVGYGGGGSQVAQQLAHILVPNMTVFEPQDLEDTNLNRVVGAGTYDVGGPKLGVARRVLQGLMPRDGLRFIPSRWQDAISELRSCDIVVGCVDSPLERRDLESECRRWLIPYIDIGLGITLSQLPDEDPTIAGQVAISVPGELCLECMAVYTQQQLEAEAQSYGDGSPAPQVVWSNAILASIAVDQVVELATGWRQRPTTCRLFRYEAPAFVGPAVELAALPQLCTHFPLAQAGPETVFKVRPGEVQLTSQRFTGTKSSGAPRSFTRRRSVSTASVAFRRSAGSVATSTV